MRLNLSSFILFFSTASTLIAAPHPTTSSSITNKINGGIYSQLGFQLNYVSSGWALTPSESSDKKQLTLKNKTARIHFNTEETRTVVDLTTYVKKYLRDYNQFGFELTGLQSIKNNQGKAVSVVLDLKQKNQKTQGRQVFYQNDKKLVIATCIDSAEQIETTLKDCNKILGSLTWL